MKEQEPRVTASHLSAGYSEPLLEDVCFALRAGEIMTLIGPNGSGKSTLLKTVAGYLRRHGGCLWFDNAPADSLSPSEKSKMLAVLLTERPRTHLMTCREVAEAGRYPYTGRFGLLSPADREAVREAMALVQMEDFAEKDFAEISDGQKQRVLLARAICQEPSILILDEPTSFLDLRHKLLFLEMIRRLAREKGIAVLMSMHEPELAAGIADTAVCVRDGRVFRMGKPEEIFQPAVLRELYDIPQELYEKYLSSNHR